MSPDGTTLAFTHRPEGGDSYRELYLSKVDGREATRLTFDRLNKKAPAWSPDGSRLAYHADLEGGSQIFVVNADGSRPIQLTEASGSSLEPDWSPDGEMILFYSNRESANFQIFKMNADGTNQQRLHRSSASDFFPRISLTNRIVFISDRGQTGKRDLYLMNLDGTSVMRLTSMPGSVWGVSWSPDGKRIAFSTNRDDPDLDPSGDYNIYVMDASGENLRRLTEYPGQELFPTWFPHGRKIVFDSDLSGGWTIHTLDLDADGAIERVNLRE